jgi:hypothetical protein
MQSAVVYGHSTTIDGRIAHRSDRRGMRDRPFCINCARRLNEKQTKDSFCTDCRRAFAKPTSYSAKLFKEIHARPICKTCFTRRAKYTASMQCSYCFFEEWCALHMDNGDPLKAARYADA